MADTSTRIIGRRGAQFAASLLMLVCSTAFKTPAATVLNLRSFGAAGNGVTDDGPAIQRALDALATSGGGTLHVPRGRYAIRTPVSKDFSGLASSITIARRLESRHFVAAQRIRRFPGGQRMVVASTARAAKARGKRLRTSLGARCPARAASFSSVASHPWLAPCAAFR